MLSHKMSFGILTPTFNSILTIKRLFESISLQTVKPDVWYIADGGSTDGTLEFLSEIPLVKIISYKDNGIYDAMNRGLEEADVDLIHILNSDDFYCLDSFIEKAIEDFEEEQNLSVRFQSICYVSKVGKPLARQWVAEKTTKELILKGEQLPHPGMVVSLRHLKNHRYDTSKKISADYKYIADLFVEKHVMKFVPDVGVAMQNNGESSKLLSRIKGNYEILQSLKELGEKPSLIKFLYHRVRKVVKQYL